MKKKDTKARTQIIFGALILALFFSVELYMMINYSEKYLIIAGIALIELIFLYVIIQGIFALKDEKEISKVIISDYIDWDKYNGDGKSGSCDYSG